MYNRKFRLTWLLTILLTVTLACSTLSGTERDLKKAKNTVKAVETQVGGVITQIGGIATAIEESGALETLAALATQAAESGLWETAQVVITEQGSEILATLQAAATQGVNFGGAPADIPVVDSQTLVNFVATEWVVSYSTTLDFQTVLDFYRREMPNNGWILLPDGTTEGQNSISLKYDKPNRTATVTIGVNPMDQKAVVAIVVQP